MKVLITDGQPQLRRAPRATLEKHKYEVFLAMTLDDGLNLAISSTPDIVLLDISLPDLSGFEICQRLRAWSQVPIIIISELDREENKIRALDMGADDYITKPFGTGELLARVRAVLRRARGKIKIDATFAFENMVIDFDKRLVQLDGKPVRLTPK